MQLLLAAQISLFGLPFIPLFPFLPFHPHNFFSQPFWNMQPAKVYSFPTHSVMQILYLYLIITILLSYPFFLEHQRKTDSTHPLFLILPFHVTAWLGAKQGSGHVRIQDFSFLICPETLYGISLMVPQVSSSHMQTSDNFLCLQNIHFLVGKGENPKPCTGTVSHLAPRVHSIALKIPQSFLFSIDFSRIISLMDILLMPPGRLCYLQKGCVEVGCVF